MHIWQMSVSQTLALQARTKDVASSPGPFPAFQSCTLKSWKAGSGPGDEAIKNVRMP